MKTYQSTHVRLLSIDDNKARVIHCDAIMDEKNVHEIPSEEFKETWKEIK
jgi:hypothetical protein